MKALLPFLIFLISYTVVAQREVRRVDDDLKDIEDFEPVFVSYRDADGDGLGNPRQHKVTDHIPSGYVRNRDDCDDTNRYIGRARTFYADADRDGHGNPNRKRISCTQPSGYVSNSADCDDTKAKMNGSTAWYFDRDHDGWGSKEIAYFGCYLNEQDIIRKLIEQEKSTSKQEFDFNFYHDDASIAELLNVVSNNDDYNDSTRYITNIPPKWFFRDADGDGFGNGSVKVYYSNQPSGYVTNSLDCNDNNRAIHPNTIWYKDQDGDGWGDAASTRRACSIFQGYVRKSGDQCPKLAGKENGCPPLGKQAGLTDENYIYTITPQESVTQKGQLLSKKHLASVTYYDGLGRPKQTVAVGVTPSGKDLVSHIGYDEFGRQDKDWLPVPASGSKGSFRDDAEAQTLSYYNHPAFDNTQNPYTERIYEASPLNRVLEVGAPGNKWKANPDSDADRTIKTDYDANGWDDLVRWFEVDFEAGNTQKPVLRDKGVYPAGQLYKNTTKDENWRHYTYSQDSNKTETYTNKQGQVILKRAFSNRSWHDTYYVYDDYGNLTFVIPPEVQTYASVWQQGDYKYVSLSNYDGLFTTPINNEAYKYGAAYLSSWDKSIRLYYGVYNLSGHTVKNGSHFDLPKMGVPLPSARLSGYAYYTTAEGERHARSITGYLMQNRITISGFPTEPLKHIRFNLLAVVGEIRLDRHIDNFKNQLQTMMYHYRYDHRNRLVEKKIPGKEWEYIAYDTQDRPVLTADAEMRKANQALKTEYDAFDRVTKTGLVTGVYGGAHKYFKASINKPIATLYTQNFYDRYSFDRQSLNLPRSAVTGTQTQGLQTGSRVRVLNTEPAEVYITTLLGYDKKGRLIYSGTHNPAIDATTQQTHTLDFVGRTLKTTTVETKNGNTLTKVDDFAYDHAGRLIDHDLTLNGQQEDLVHNTYDELGQLAQKTVGGGLQTIDYDYNIRGWLRHINNPDALGDDLFGFELDYGNLYNGNIQNTYWKTANDGIKRRYYYYYDGLNRLNGATYYAPGTWGAYRTWYNYDRNGNIKRLSRRGAQNVGIDYLTYAYNGNQLLAVTDSYNHSEGFDDGNTNGFDYIYDANGNLTQDKNKGITMRYNHLNLPVFTQVKHDGHLKYTYDALGNKLEKEVYTYGGYGAAIDRTFYVGSSVYTQKAFGGRGAHTKPVKLEFIHTPEGYAQPTAGGFDFVYQYKDHLGNNRLSYTKDTNGKPKIVSETNYYPFGLAHKGYNERFNVAKNNYKTFQDQEWTEDLGLNWYEFAFRQYDPAIGRFTAIDPIADSYPHNGTYNFSENRVTDGIELEGLEYVSRIHIMDGNNHLATMDINYYQMSEEQIKAAGGTYQGLDNAASYGPEGKGVKHTYINSDSKSKYNGTTWDYRDDSTRHGLYSGAGAITDWAGNDDFSFQPIDLADAIAKEHDRDYANVASLNYKGFVEDTRTLTADILMVNRVNSVLTSSAPLARQYGLETPFRGGFSGEMYRALGGQSLFIGALANYKGWKSNRMQSLGLSPDKPQDMAKVSIMGTGTFLRYSANGGVGRAAIIRAAESKRLENR